MRIGWADVAFLEVLRDHENAWLTTGPLHDGPPLLLYPPCALAEIAVVLRFWRGGWCVAAGLVPGLAMSGVFAGLLAMVEARFRRSAFCCLWRHLYRGIACVDVGCGGAAGRIFGTLLARACGVLGGRINPSGTPRGNRPHRHALLTTEDKHRRQSAPPVSLHESWASNLLATVPADCEFFAPFDRSVPAE